VPNKDKPVSDSSDPVVPAPRPKADSIDDALHVIEMENTKADERWEIERRLEIDRDIVALSAKHRAMSAADFEDTIARKFPPGQGVEADVQDLKKAAVYVQDVLLFVEPMTRRAMATANRALRENDGLRQTLMTLTAAVVKTIRVKESADKTTEETLKKVETTLARIDKREIKRDTKLSVVTLPALSAFLVVIAGMLMKMDDKVTMSLAGALSILVFELVKRVRKEGLPPDEKSEEKTETKQ
jgi:hypothetical protein